MAKPIESEVSRYKTLPQPFKVLFLALCVGGVGLAVFYIFGFHIEGRTLLDIGYYYLLIGLFLSAAFLVLPMRKKDQGVPWYDLMAVGLSLGTCFYFFLNAHAIRAEGWLPPSPLAFSFALVLFLLVLEGGRRSGGFIFLVISIIFAIYPVIAGYMPGVLWGVGRPITDAIGLTVFSSESLLGLPTAVVGEILIGYLLFAGLLIGSGGADFFLKLSLALLGRYRGGPAKVAVVASGFFGSLSGSIMANVVATGSVTIPTMKRIGYPSHYAGAIEACSSTGGVLMPPVMGTTAFVMCTLIGVSYPTVIIAAAIPSILYYFGLLMQVDAYAARVGLRGLTKEEVPSLKKTLIEGWPFLLVLIFLIWALLWMRWERMAPFYASGLLLLLSFTSRKTMMTPKKLVEAFAQAGKLVAQVMAILLPIGLIIGGLTVTGTAPSLTAGLVSLGGGNIVVVLLLGVLVCYILGMAGLLTPAYVFLALTLAPAMVSLGGINVLAIHLFIMYYAMLAAITPPVAQGAFVGASIAGSSPMKTAFQAMRLGIVIYLIPFFFIFNPALIFEGPILETVYLFILCLLGITLIAGGMEGHLVKVGNLRLLERPFLAIAGFLIAFPEWKTTIIGGILASLVIAVILIRRKKEVRTEVVSQTNQIK